jgi:hypothetical protein
MTEPRRAAHPVPSREPAATCPPGQTTLRRWAPRHGRTYDYVRQFWRRRPGFPDPVGELPARGRHGGGPGELLFDEAALDAWLAAQPDLAPPERIDPSAAGIDPQERITLTRFAKLAGRTRQTVAQHRDRPGFPPAEEDGTYRTGDLLQYWNSRTGRRRTARLRRPRQNRHSLVPANGQRLQAADQPGVPPLQVTGVGCEP